MNLYDLSEGFLEIQRLLDKAEEDQEETGGASWSAEELAEMLDRVDEELNVKGGNISAWIKTLKAEKVLLNATAKSLYERARKKQRRIDSLKRYALAVMKDIGVFKLKSGIHSLTRRMSPRPTFTAIRDDLKGVPEEFVRPRPSELMKNDLYAHYRKWLKEDASDDPFDVPGVEVATEEQLVVK
jgi:hypothetical protein